MMQLTITKVDRTFRGKYYEREVLSPDLGPSLISLYEEAYKDGNWKPRKRRVHWWQVWRPIELEWIERHFDGREVEP
ncbi:hypothetical protein BFS86_19555 [Shewanella algae]|nr:hypothetical protein BFS86_19555 [Shewanella algae]DAU40275.1 MAG TPA: hypothetical protein [Caudoviricetes sp.]